MDEQERAVELVRIRADVMRVIRDAQRPRESYNDCLRRLLGLAERREAQERRVGANG